MDGSTLGGVCFLVPGGGAGISVRILVKVSNLIRFDVCTGAVVAAAVVVSDGATVAAAVVDFVSVGSTAPNSIRLSANCCLCIFNS